MTLIDIGESLPWSGRTTQGGVGDCGPYSHLDWQALWGYASPYGAQSNAGIVPGSFNELTPFTAHPIYGPLEIRATTPASTAVTITPGTAIVQGIKYTLDTATNQTIAANASGNPRIDAIVLRADYAAQTVRPYYLQGTPAVTPALPTLTRTGAPVGFWDVVLAYIEVANGFASIAQVSIQDGRQYISPDRCGFAINSPSGVGTTAIYEAGYPLVVGANLESGGSLTLDSHRIMGVAEHYIESPLGLYAGRIITHGLAYVEVSEAVAVGEYLEQSSTAGQARGTATPEHGFAVALSASTGAGQKVLALILPAIPNQPAYLKYVDSASGSITSGAWRTRTISSEVTDTAGIGSLAANRITIPAGTYYARISGMAYGTNQHQCRLQNITAGATVLYGRPAYTAAAAVNVTESIGAGQFTIAVASDFELQHQANTTNANANALGIAGGFGGTDVFGQVELWRLYT